jgi:hypothetical protein
VLQTQANTTSSAVLAVLQADGQNLTTVQQDALQPVLKTLFGHTHDFAHAPIMRYFQHLAIGSHNIQPTYDIEAQFSSSAYLQEYDISLLSEKQCVQVSAAIEAGKIGAVVYTARPSLPPVDVTIPTLGYSPEAELARTLVGLETLPLIGLGRLRWLATQTGADVATLVKPSPVQALAAIGAAWSKQETASLMAAWALFDEQRLISPLENLPALTVHVFEDSPGGLRAVRDAVTALNHVGLAITYQPYGITPASGTKYEAMTQMNVRTYRSVNEAINVAMKAW